MKKLALFLALCLLAATLPAGAWAEDVEEFIVEEVPPEAEGETGAEGLTAEPEGDAPEDDYDVSQYEQGEPIDADLAPDEDLGEPDVAGPQVVEPDAGQAVAPAPHVDPNGPTLASNELTLGVGETFALAGKLPDGTSAGIAYASTDAAVASVAADGTVTALAPGDITVTATAQGGQYAECFVSVKDAPDTVSFSAAKITLGKGEIAESLQVVLGSQPGLYAGSYKITSSRKKIVSVGPGNVVKGLKTGKSTLTVKTYNGKTAKCVVTVVKPPKKVTAKVDKAAMGIGETGQISHTLPKKTAGQVQYSSDDPTVVTVDAATGQMTAVGLGTALVRVTTYNNKTHAVSVTVANAPVTLTFPSEEFVMGAGMSVKSAAQVNEGAAAGIQYAVADPSVAIFDKGAIKALKQGTTQLTATTYNGLTATCNLVVKAKPAWVKLPYKKLNLYVGDSVQLVPDVGDSASTFTYTTSNKKKVKVSPDGIVTGVAKGTATVTVKTYNNKRFKLKVVVSKKATPPGNPSTELPVSLEGMSLDIPDRTTDVDGIPANLARIDAIRASALKQINAMRSAGIITEADANKRKSIVNNAFADYAFPWMTPALQKYWKAANSEGGVKDFKPDRVYYGLPYISGSGANRQYNAARALSEGRFTNSGSGYFLLNQKNLRNKRYCGNDCSGFVDGAIWGTGNKHSGDRTTDIASSSAYRTVKEYGALRTGDLICKSAAHVVMFLYWASPDKTQMMIIENGGIEPGTNTVHCIIMDTAFYTKRGYKVRRLASLG